MKVLITGGNSAISLKLSKAFNGFDIFLADYGEVPTIQTSSYKMVSLGPKNIDVIAHNLLNYCLDNGIDYLLPLHSFEIEPLARAKVLFEEFDILILGPDLTQMELLSPTFKSPSFSVFLKGAALYHSIENPNISVDNLSGAYYADDNGNISLITVE